MLKFAISFPTWFWIKKQGKDRANIKSKGMGLVKKMQKVTSADTDFLRIPARDSHQKILAAEFEDTIQASASGRDRLPSFRLQRRNDG